MTRQVFTIFPDLAQALAQRPRSYQSHPDCHIDAVCQTTRLTNFVVHQMSTEGTQRGIYPILVCQFNYQGHSDDAPHWALVVLISRHVAYIYEVLGGIDNFFFQRRRLETFVGSQTLRGGCKVGEIPADHLEFLEQKLRETPVVRQDPEWTSRTWVVHAIRLLQEYKMVFSHVNERQVREELACDLVRWHELEDTIVERTYPE